MRTEETRRFVIEASQIATITKRLEDLGAQLLMERGYLTRAIFADAHKRATRRRGGIIDRRPPGWVRVRMGEDEQDPQAATLTYKTIEKANLREVERVVDLAVDDFDKAVEFLQEVGLRLKSRQESIRTKYSVKHLECRYVVNFDVWPWLEDIVFVSVNPVDGMPAEDFDDLCDNLRLEACGGRNYVGGVDEIYTERLGFRLQDIEDVRFGIPRPEPQNKGTRIAASTPRQASAR